ncbi:MAG: hypothetical protein JO099_17270 [Acidobacteriia bacterium]|nr:hypothetical protein [Terriglobia bacterium]
MSDISPAQLAANRANAQLSTGPTSEAGRHRSSLNATKHGLSGRTVVLSGKDLFVAALGSSRCGAPCGWTPQWHCGTTNRPRHDRVEIWKRSGGIKHESD